MSVGKPVVACNSGGPVESCRDGVTGFTCPSEPEEFARAMNHLGDGHNKADRMGYLAQARIMNVFSRKSFGEELHSHLTYLSSTACFPACPPSVAVAGKTGHRKTAMRDACAAQHVA
eukprot:30999-Pelagococcus_subviridis.AAC.12